MKKILSVFLVMSLMTGLSARGSKATNAGRAEPVKTEAEAQSGEEKKETKGKEESRGKKESRDNMVVMYSAYSLGFLDPLVEEPEKKTSVKVDLIATSAGELPRRIESETSDPLGDILFAGTVSTVAPQAYLFEDYVSPNEEFIISGGHRNVERSITGTTLMPGVLMINTNLIGDLEINGYEDLLNPGLKGKIATASPTQTASEWEHLVNMLHAVENGDTDEAWNFVEKFCENLDGRLLSSSSAVYKDVADREYTVGLTYEAGGADYVVAGAPVKLVYMEGGVIFRGTNIRIVKDTPHTENAQKFVDFITGKEAQTMMTVDLNNREIRNNLPDSPIPKSYSEVNVIKDNESVAIDNKTNQIEHFVDICTNVQ